MSDARPQGVVPAHGHGGHRQDRIDSKGLSRFAVWLIVSVVVIHVALAALFAVFKMRSDQADEPPLPMQVERKNRPKVEPTLRVDETRQYRLMLEAYERQQDQLKQNPRVDPRTGIGAIPIEHAMRLYAEGRRVRLPSGGSGGATQPSGGATQPASAERGVR
jgi:hypothetical protein